MFCTHCGEEFIDKHKFCMHCGASALNSDKAAEANENQNSSLSSIAPKQANYKKSGFLGYFTKFLLGCLIIVAFIAVDKGIQFLNEKTNQINVGSSVNRHLSGDDKPSESSQLLKYTDKQMVDEAMAIMLNTLKEVYVPLTSAEKEALATNYLEPSSYEDIKNIKKIQTAFSRIEEALEQDGNYQEEYARKIKENIQKSDKLTSDFKKGAIEGFEEGRSNASILGRQSFILAYKNYVEEVVLLYNFMLEHHEDYSISSEDHKLYFNEDKTLETYNEEVEILNYKLKVYQDKQKEFDEKRGQVLGKYNIDTTNFDSFLHK